MSHLGLVSPGPNFPTQGLCRGSRAFTPLEPWHQTYHQPCFPVKKSMTTALRTCRLLRYASMCTSFQVCSRQCSRGGSDARSRSGTGRGARRNVELLLVELDIPTPPGVKWTGHSFRRGGASAAHDIGVSIAVIMAWGLWKSLASALLYIDVSVRPSPEALFFFGHLLPRFNLPQAPLVRQATPTDVSSSIDLSDTLEALLEFDD